MHRRQTAMALTMASVLLAAPSFAQEDDDTGALPKLRSTLAATPAATNSQPRISSPMRVAFEELPLSPMPSGCQT